MSKSEETQEVKVDIHIFEEVAKEVGEDMVEEFEYCTGYLALGQSGDEKIGVELTLRDIKILETGLKHYKEAIQNIKPWDEIEEELLKEDYKMEDAECDKILSKLKIAQVPIFKQLTPKDVNYMYAHKIIGLGTWTGGGTVQ